MLTGSVLLSTLIILITAADLPKRIHGSDSPVSDSRISKFLEQAEKDLDQNRPGSAYISAGKALSLLLMSEKGSPSAVTIALIQKQIIPVMKRAARNLENNNPTGDDHALTLGSFDDE